MIAPVPAAPAAVFGLPEWAGRLTLAGLVIVGALVLLSAVGWLVPRLANRAGRPRDGARSRQRQTAVTALASGLRYVILVAAIVAIILAFAGGGSVAAVSGGALVVVIAGFASQRLLVDAIAGFFILFEDEYGVGDVVRLEPSGYTGEVESIGLRATALRGPGSERIIIPNGQITGIRVIPSGRRPVRLELLTSDPEALSAVVHEIAGAVAGAGGPWDGPPRVVVRPTQSELARVIVIVEVDPVREGGAEGWLAEALTARAGDLLVGPPLSISDRTR